MKHQSKQMVAWVIAVGASTALFGTGSWAVRTMAARAGHAATSEGEHNSEGEHGDSHEQPVHEAEHGEEHASAEGEGEHKAAERGEEKAAAEHSEGHKEAEHGEEHAAAEHGEGHKGAEHGEEHAAAEHGEGHKEGAKHGEEHAAAEHGEGPKGAVHGEEHASAEHGEKKQEQKGATHWSYDRSAAEGPSSWGKISPDFAACEKGREQSPIDLTGAHRSAAAPKLTFHYAPTEVTVENNGHTIQSTMANDQNFVMIDDEKYNLAQFHFHSPSEHRVGGIPADMEMHFVHKNKAGKLAVIGVMIKETPKGENALFKSLWELLPREFGTKADSQPTMNLLSILPKHHEYFHYAGSLTTPPCSEGVRWFVMQESIPMSAGQVDMYSSIFGANTNRPVQPVFTRQIIESIGPTDVAH